MVFLQEIYKNSSGFMFSCISFLSFQFPRWEFWHQRRGLRFLAPGFLWKKDSSISFLEAEKRSHVEGSTAHKKGGNIMAYELNSASIGGNLTADPDIRYTSGDAPTAIARYTLAVNRRTGDADYIRCVVFGKQAEYAEKYLKKGAPVLVTGCIRTGSYTNSSGTRVNTMEVIADRQTTEKEGALNLNAILLFGRLTRDPDVRYTQGENPVCITRYTLAVPRKYLSKRTGDDDNTGFIPCIAFGEAAEFVKKYLKKGTSVVVHGRIQTGSYTNKDGIKVHTIEVLAEGHDFAGRKNTGMTNVEPPKEENGIGQGSSLDTDALISGHKDSESKSPDSIPDGFTDLPEDEDDVLPFN